MHIPVSDSLAQEVGYRKGFEVADEQPELEDIALAEPITGTASLVRLENGVGVQASLATAQVLECHRCLQPYVWHNDIEVKGEFSRQPGGNEPEEQLPIAKDFTIDIAPLVRQEMILGIPIQQLCKPDCKGIDPDTGQPYEITDKEPHGSTQKAKN